MSSKKSEKSKSITKDSTILESQPIEKQNESVSEAPLENPKEIKTVVITVDYLRNVSPLYSVADVKVNLKYLNQNLGESQVVPVTDTERLTINEHFEIEIDMNSPKQLDLIASNPVIITAIQSTGTLDAELYEQLKNSQDDKQPTKPVEEVESLFSMYEAFTGERPSVQLSDMKKKKKGKKEKSDKSVKEKDPAASKTSKISKKSKSSKSSSRSDRKSRSDTPIIKSEIYGMCVIDLIPLFYGRTSFTEALLIQPVKRSCQILSTFKNFPEVNVTVSTKDNTKLLDIRNILNFTVESICNVPALMSTDMDCKVCALLPLQNNGAAPTLFYNPKITNKALAEQLPKRWPGTHDIGYNANTTKYFINTNFDEVTNRHNLDLKEGFKEEEVRIEFNYLKRNIIFKTGNSEFAGHIQTHRKLALEIYLTPKTKKYDPTADVTEELSHTKSKGAKIPPYLHLMAVLDVVALMYPGVTRLRIAAPVSTFTFEEAAKAGLNDSFFMPKPKSDLSTEKASKFKLEASKKKKAEKKEKSSKKDKASTVVEEKNLANQLPPKPEELPPPEPSVQVYNEDGKPCFIIVEMELLSPFIPKQDIEELKADLYQLQMEALQSSKTILNKHVADDLYLQTIKDIINDLNRNWIKYNEEMQSIPQPTYIDFVEYLQKIGSYQAYLNSIVTAATLLITNKYKCDENDFKNSKTYQNLVSEVFTDLIAQMHSVLNSLASTGMLPLQEKYNTPSDVSFFYAKETAELKLYARADRYFMERIINDNKDHPDFWFDYAIYNIEINDTEKAFECVKEAIAMSCANKYIVILFGLLLADKGNMHDAEICLLNIMILEAKWAEGWCILYLFYQKWGRIDGMEMAIDMGRKLMDDTVFNDYFCDFEDLAWSWKHIPNTLFFKTAILLLKMRLYFWVEQVLAEETLIPKYYGYVNYLLAVVSYYKKDYDHALQHIEEAKESLGADPAILELSGHALFGQDKLDEAKEEYFHLIESFDIPKDIHVVYLNCAEILSKEGDHQKARKLLLTACKKHQTPHIWFSVGKLYYLQNDILSAEECFTEANMKDNRHPEVWGYLTLVNLKLNRLNEAEQCYQQAIKSNLNNDSLNASIIEEFNRAASLY